MNKLDPRFDPRNPLDDKYIQMNKNIISASGTAGDAFIIICKIYDLVKNEDHILCEHITNYDYLHEMIRGIFSLMPNIEVTFVNKENATRPILTGHFFDMSSLEKSLKITAFPILEFIDIGKFNLPKKYAVLQPKAGTHKGNFKEFSYSFIKNKASSSDIPVCLVSDDFYDIDGHNIINLTSKTNVQEAMSIVKSSDEFIGFGGLLGFLSMSQKIKTEFIYNSIELKISMEARMCKEWYKYCDLRELS
jgi:hypothetical protein